MRLAISNIAWSANEDVTIPTALRAAGADAIEAAPGRLFRDPASAAPEEIAAARRVWSEVALPIVSMQALLSGRNDLKLLGSAAETDDFVDYLSQIIALAHALGCGPLVFGSPKSRIKGDLTFGAATAGAVPTLRRLGDVAQAAGCVLCLEANASAYGCDFMTTLDEAAAVIRAVDHPAVGLVVDTGTMQMMGEAPAAVAAVAPLVRHLHLSMPHLAPVTADAAFLRETLTVLYRTGYAGTANIEMLKPGEGGAEDRAVGAITAVRRWIDTL